MSDKVECENCKYGKAVEGIMRYTNSGESFPFQEFPATMYECQLEGSDPPFREFGKINPLRGCNQGIDKRPKEIKFFFNKGNH